jgi:hypothetical protein
MYPTSIQYALSSIRELFSGLPNGGPPLSNASGAAKLKAWIDNGSVGRGMHRKDQPVMLCLQLAKV